MSGVNECQGTGHLNLKPLLVGGGMVNFSILGRWNRGLQGPREQGGACGIRFQA